MECIDKSDKQLKEIKDEEEVEEFQHLPEATQPVPAFSSSDVRNENQELEDNEHSQSTMVKEEELSGSNEALEDSSTDIQEENPQTSSSEGISLKIEESNSVEGTEITSLLQEVSDAITDIDTVVTIITNDFNQEDLPTEEDIEEIMDSATEIALQKELEEIDDAVKNDDNIHDKACIDISGENEESKNTEITDNTEKYQMEDNNASWVSVDNNISPTILSNAVKKNVLNKKNKYKNKKKNNYNINLDFQVISNLPKEYILDFTADDYNVSFPRDKLENLSESLGIENERDKEDTVECATLDNIQNSSNNENNFLPAKQKNKNANKRLNAFKAKRRSIQNQKKNKIKREIKMALNHIKNNQELHNICNVTIPNQNIGDLTQQNKAKKLLKIKPNNSKTINKNKLAPPKEEQTRIKQKPKGNQQNAKKFKPKKRQSQNNTIELIKEVLNYVKVATKKLLPNYETYNSQPSTSTHVPFVSYANVEMSKNNGNNKNLNKQVLNQMENETINLQSRPKQIVNNTNSSQNNPNLRKNTNHKNKVQVGKNNRKEQLFNYALQQNKKLNKFQHKNQNTSQKSTSGQQYNNSGNNFVINNSNVKQKTGKSNKYQSNTQPSNYTAQQNRPNMRYRNESINKHKNYNENSRHPQDRCSPPIPSLMNLPLLEFNAPPNRNQSNHSSGRRNYSPIRNLSYDSHQSGSSIQYDLNRRRERSISPESQSRRNIPLPRDIRPEMSESSSNSRNMPTSTYVPSYHPQERNMNMDYENIGSNGPTVGSSNLDYGDRIPHRSPEPFKRPASLSSEYSPNKKKKLSHVDILREKEALLLKLKQRDRMLKELESAQREIDSSLEALNYF